MIFEDCNRIFRWNWRNFSLQLKVNYLKENDFYTCKVNYFDMKKELKREIKIQSLVNSMWNSNPTLPHPTLTQAPRPLPQTRKT